MLRTQDKRLFLGRTLADVTQEPAAQLPVTSGLLAWYDASDTSTITESGGAVSQWNDKSANAYHLTQSTAGLKPTTGTRTQNGRNVIDWDGGDEMTSSCPNSDSTASYFVVGLLDDLSTFRPVLGGDGGNGGVCFRLQTAGGGQWQLEKDGVAAYLTSTIPNPGTGVAFGMAVILNSASTPTALAEVSSSTSPSRKLTGTPTYAFTAGRTLLLGTQDGRSGRWDGWMGEIVIFDRALTSPEVAEMMNYLQAKWVFSWT